MKNFHISPNVQKTTVNSQNKLTVATNSLTLAADNQRRVQPDVCRLYAREASLLEPLSVFTQCIRSALLRMQEHVQGKNQGINRAGALLVRHHINYGNSPGRPQSSKQAGEQAARGRHAFRVANVSE